MNADLLHTIAVGLYLFGAVGFLLVITLDGSRRTMGRSVLALVACVAWPIAGPVLALGFALSDMVKRVKPRRKRSGPS